MRSYLEEVDSEAIEERFDAFWDREILDRPLICITAPRKNQRKLEFPVPKCLEDRWTNVEYVLKKMELYLENTGFLGDAIPWYWPNLGPNHFTACIGGDLVFRDESTSWVEPFIEDLSEFDPELDEKSKWWRIMDDLLDAMCELAEGNFLVGIPDLHYGGDSLSAALGPQDLVRCFFQEPDRVKRLIKTLTDLCIEMFDSYYGKISRVQEGSITWIPAYSRGRYFALQDDFSGFLSPDMFREFIVEQEVERISRYLDNSIFHLDGPLALGNLDILLDVDSLDGIQWVPGAGAEPMSRWVEVCSTILDAGKCLQISCEPHEVGFLLSRLKHEGLLLATHCNSEREARSLLKMVEQSHR